MTLAKIFKSQWFWLSLIIILSTILRFWNISSFQHLSYDESRDYIILKRILVDHKFTLVGPTVSIAPGFYLPPFYYYSLLPFIKLSGFHINGPDIYTAILGVFSVIFFYFLSRDLFGVFPALISSLLFSANPYLVQTSRHAWNPNTLFLYSILFFFSVERYIFKKQRKYFILAGFSLGWAIGLHLTAVVFLPIFIYLIFLEIKTKKINKYTILGIGFFLIIFSPLLFFDLKHDFPISKAAISYVKGSEDTRVNGQMGERVKEMIIDLYKMPIILLSGTFQKENMTVRPSNITNFSILSVLTFKKGLEGTKMILTLYLWLITLFSLIFSKEKKFKIILVFLLFGLLIRICFPVNLFYFYYYLSVFPIVFLILAFAIKKSEKKVLIRIPIVISALFLLISSYLPWGIYQDPKTEKYFLSVSKIIANDSVNRDKVSIASNVADKSRWEHNGLEYRYFAEALYNLKARNWEASDYRDADVLYFIDEGDVKEPLKFGGMEVEAFRPTKIEKTWKVETGQTIYKMIK